MPVAVGGTGTLSGASIGASNVITMSVTVRVGDLIVALMAQQTALTASSCSDSLGNTYTAQNAGTLSGAISGRLFHSRVTVGGSLTSVTIAATSSTNDFACCAAVFTNGFDSSLVDTNPANTSGDITSPFTGPASGTLAQAYELIVGWAAHNANAVWTSSTPFTTAVNVNRANATAIIQFDDTTATTTQTATFTGTAPTNNVMGLISFKQTVPLGQACL